MINRTGLLCTLVIGILSCNVNAYNYLFVLPTAAPSHYSVVSALALGLADAGHQVTIISAFTLKKPVPNITEVEAPGLKKSMGLDIAKLLVTAQKSPVQKLSHFNYLGPKITRALLEEPKVQTLLKSKQKFDAVICEIFLNEAHLGFAEHFNAPLIALSTSEATTWSTDLVGTPSPPSYVPHIMLSYSDKMTLVERIGNLAYITLERINLELNYLPIQSEIYKKFFPNNKLTLEETRRNTALVLLNQHVSLSFPRPYAPNMIEVGGMHINHKVKPLPADIEKFINEAKHGVIYFSMGSNLKSKDLPLEKRQAILNVFSKLKQRVLWKFEDSNLPNKPNNVFISDWFPQADILAHNNVLAFITHGGLLGTTESIYHGKPVIGIPIFGDQFLNMARAEQNGYGITMKYNELTEETFGNAIERIINDPQYMTTVREVSARMRDQMETPLERAVYWVEHVTRHKGARYLRSASQDLNFIQYHNLDAMLILYGGILLVFSLVMFLIRRFFRWLQEVFINRAENAQKKVKRH